MNKKIKHRQFWVEEGQARAFYTDDQGVDHDIEKMIAENKQLKVDLAAAKAGIPISVINPGAVG